MKEVVFNGQIPRDMVNADYEFHHYCTDFRSVPLHYHDFYEIYILLSDSVTYLVDGRYYNLQRGDILLLGPHEMHSPLRVKHENQAYERIDIYIRPEFFTSHNPDGIDLRSCFERCQSSSSGNLLRPQPRLAKDIDNVLQQIQDQSNFLCFGSSILHEVLPLQLLVYLNRASIENHNRNAVFDVESHNSVIDPLIYHINCHLSDSLSLDELAEVAHVSKCHLVRLFKQQTKLTPIQYVRYKRLLKARTLLSENSCVTSACHECGFSDYANFIRAFKKEFGISPGRYAKVDSQKQLEPFETLLLDNRYTQEEHCPRNRLLYVGCDK